MGPADLKIALANLPIVSDPKVIRGMEAMDNAGVYRLTDDLALIQSVDFFTPVVDDPYAFGQIAVVNALSDVYAMGGTPVTAMNLVCFPTESMEITILKDILRGGADKMLEAKVVLLGGHSIDDVELKYGLSVTATVHPEKLLTNSGARPGDKVILTKPLGAGIISTALKAGQASQSQIATITRSMLTLNDKASALMVEAGAHACTDITGFGFIGHVSHLAQNSGVGMNINLAALPAFPGALELVRRGFCPGGLQRNREFYSGSAQFAPEVPSEAQDVLYDPQTSGGLFICVSPDKAEGLLGRLKAAGVSDAAIIGEVVSEPKGIITVR